MKQNPERLGREQPIEITAEVQGNYRNFKRQIAEKKLSSQKSTKASHAISAATFQKLTTTNWEKVVPKKPYFLEIFSQNSNKRFFAQPEGHMNNDEMLTAIRRHTRGNFPGDERRSKLLQRAKTIVALHLKSTLARPPI